MTSSLQVNDSDGHRGYTVYLGLDERYANATLVDPQGHDVSVISLPLPTIKTNRAPVLYWVVLCCLAASLSILGLLGANVDLRTRLEVEQAISASLDSDLRAASEKAMAYQEAARALSAEVDDLQIYREMVEGDRPTK